MLRVSFKDKTQCLLSVPKVLGFILNLTRAAKSTGMRGGVGVQEIKNNVKSWMVH